MATIITKNSSTASAAPAVGDLTKGELAVNVTDKKLYTKDNSAAIVKIVGSLGNQEASAVAITGGSIAGITDLAVADGGTGASSAADARTNLGVTATGADTTYAFRSNNLSDLASASTARTNLGLGTIATQAASSVTITGGSVTGITDITVADGGTGASTAANARTNLGAAASGANSDITSITGLTTALTVAQGGTGVTTSTGTGNAVLSNSPTLVTPTLGTPASATLTNATGLPISTGVSGLGTGVATALAVNVGSAGAAVVNGGALGTPSSGTATNLTGLPLSTGVTGTLPVANGGTGVTTSTGSGNNVLSTSPTLVTPILGTPTSATLTNATGLPLSTGVTGTLPVANGGTGTATPSIVAGTNVTVTGTWPNQTIAASGGGSGTVTSVAASVPSLFSISGSPITTSGTLAMTYSGTALPVANGGTGQTSYTDGQLLIGNSTGNTLTKATLTAGTNVTITNSAGAITIAATGGGGSGDVVGPASSTDNAFARFDSTTGKLLQNSTGATLSDTGAAVFTGALDVLGNSTAGSNIKLYEDTDNGTNYVAFKAPDTIASNVTWTLPAADGTSAQVLSTNGSGTLSWATAGGGSSQWTTSGSNIYYNTGNVGIGTSSPDSNAGYSALSISNTTGAQVYLRSTTGTVTGLVGADNAGGGLGYLATNTDHALAFRTNNTERARFNTTGAFVLAGGTTTANGIGITFPATQSASTNANTLDDYEEGTFTPVMTFGGGSAGQSVTGATGWYTKVGRLVNFHHYLELSNKGSSTGNAVITGLPFNMDAYGGATLGYVLGITYTGTLAPLVDGTSIYMYQSSSGNASGAITNTAFSSPFRIDLNYTVNVV